MKKLIIFMIVLFGAFGMMAQDTIPDSYNYAFSGVRYFVSQDKKDTLALHYNGDTLIWITNDSVNYQYLKDTIVAYNYQGLWKGVDTSYFGTGSGGTNNYVDGATFNTGDGVLTLSRVGLGDLTEDLDGRYVESESDPVFTAAIRDSVYNYEQDSSLARTGDLYTDSDIPASYLEDTEIDTETEFETVLFNVTTPGELDYYTDSDIPASYLEDTEIDTETEFETVLFTLDYYTDADIPASYLQDTDIDTEAEFETELFTLNYYTDSDIDGTESAFTGWDKDASNDFDDFVIDTVTAYNYTGLWKGVDTSYFSGDGGGTNNYVNSVTFNTGDGILTLGRAGLGDLTEDLDGRYLQSESDPDFFDHLASDITTSDTTWWGSHYTDSDIPASYLQDTEIDTEAEFESVLFTLNYYTDADIPASYLEDTDIDTESEFESVLFTLNYYTDSDIPSNYMQEGENNSLLNNNAGYITSQTDDQNLSVTDLTGNSLRLDIEDGNNVTINGGGITSVTRNTAQEYTVSSTIPASYLQDTDIDTETEFESVLFTLDYYTDSDIDGTESAFTGWDKNASDDFDGSSIDNLSDVNLSGESSGEVLRYNGSNWVNGISSAKIETENINDGTENNISYSGFYNIWDVSGEPNHIIHWDQPDGDNAWQIANQDGGARIYSRDGNPSTGSWSSWQAIAWESELYTDADIPASYLQDTEIDTETEFESVLFTLNYYTDSDIPASYLQDTEIDTETEFETELFTFNHFSSNGSDHGYINQSVTTTATPTFGGMTLNGQLHGSSDALTTDTLYAPDFVLSSDRRLKRDIESISNPYTALYLQPVQFQWKSTGNVGVGFVAQDLQERFPYLVRKRPDGYLGISYGKITALNNALVQRLFRQVEQLEKENKRIKTKIRRIEEWLESNTSY